MTDPISFTSSTARFGLPLLFAAQAQKEFFVNEAHVLADALLHPVVEGSASSDPATPASGECWIVDTAATGSFVGHDESLACYHEGQWLFATPSEGMAVYDRSLSRLRYYAGGWQDNPAIAEPAGGSVIDQEARNALNDVIAAIRKAGILPPS